MTRTNRIDIVLEKLTEISGELKAMITIHEHRLNQQEKETDGIHTTLEKRLNGVDNTLIATPIKRLVPDGPDQ